MTESEKETIFKSIDAHTSAIKGLTAAINTQNKEVLSLRILLAAVLLELSENEVSRDSFAQHLAHSIRWYESHALGSTLPEEQVDNLAEHMLSKIPERIQPLVKQLLQLP